MAVEARQLAPDLVQLDKPVDRAQQMIGRNALFQRELIEQRSLLDLPMSDHELQSCRSIRLVSLILLRRNCRIFQHNRPYPVFNRRSAGTPMPAVLPKSPTRSLFHSLPNRI